MNALDDLREIVSNHDEGDLLEDYVDVIDMALNDIESEWIELPKDADGVPIKPGDKVLTPGGDTVTVKFVGKGDGVRDGVCYCRKGTGHTWDEARKCHYVKPDSWDRLFDDVQRTGHAPHTNDEWIKRAKALSERGA